MSAWMVLVHLACASVLACAGGGPGIITLPLFCLFIPLVLVVFQQFRPLSCPYTLSVGTDVPTIHSRLLCVMSTCLTSHISHCFYYHFLTGYFLSIWSLDFSFHTFILFFFFILIPPLFMFIWSSSSFIWSFSFFISSLTDALGVKRLHTKCDDWLEVLA